MESLLDYPDLFTVQCSLGVIYSGYKGYQGAYIGRTGCTGPTGYTPPPPPPPAPLTRRSYPDILSVGIYLKGTTIPTKEDLTPSKKIHDDFIVFMQGMDSSLDDIKVLYSSPSQIKEVTRKYENELYRAEIDGIKARNEAKREKYNSLVSSLEELGVECDEIGYLHEEYIPGEYYLTEILGNVLSQGYVTVGCKFGTVFYDWLETNNLIEPNFPEQYKSKNVAKSDEDFKVSSQKIKNDQEERKRSTEFKDLTIEEKREVIHGPTETPPEPTKSSWWPLW